MLVIKPDECIDCGVCEPECPAEAILADTHEDAKPWIDFNARYAELWPVINQTRDPLPSAQELDGVDGKLKSHFVAEPVRHTGAEA